MASESRADMGIAEVIKKREKGGFSGSAGGDLAEIISYYLDSKK